MKKPCPDCRCAYNGNKKIRFGSCCTCRSKWAELQYKYQLKKEKEAEIVRREFVDNAIKEWIRKHPRPKKF